MNKIKILKKKFKEIKELGYIECKRENIIGMEVLEIH